MKILRLLHVGFSNHLVKSHVQHPQIVLNVGQERQMTQQELYPLKLRILDPEVGDSLL